MSTNFVLQDRFLERFFAGPLGEHFYLTGGTALSRFYFYHRESLDLDLFTNDFGQDFAQVNRVILGILHALTLQITSQVVTDTFIQYIVTDPGGNSLKVDLVKDVPVHFGPLVERDGIRLDSLENIGSNKILAIFGRTDAKDFIDLYWMLHHTGLKFDQLFHQANQKDLGLSEFYLAYALQNVEKIRLFPRMLKPLAWEDVRAYFHALARELLARIKPK
ncbi:MAG: nucleotidyl transferase AbiEii/AbiGii toxin family protein [Anaerolineales bacterium]|nr:nucleotidyl transferase AbiEii/AbiGii toxin family protein [Anaerolineales bacterium]